MKIEEALAIVYELRAWVNYHEENGPIPDKRFEHRLYNVALAREKVLAHNVGLQAKGKGTKMIAVPSEAACAGIVLCSQMVKQTPVAIMKSFMTANGAYCLLTKKETEVFPEDYVDPNQVDLTDAIAEEESKKGDSEV